MTELVDGHIFSDSRRAVILSTGSALPEKILSNDDLEKIVDTSDEWIKTRTGISQRRIAAKGQTTASIGLEAAKKALDRVGFDAKDLDAIICATITPEMVFPSTACFIQEGLGNIQCCAFDLAAACSGYVYAMNVAASMINSGQCKNILVVGSETLSKIVNYQDRASCILFGDGAGAVLLGAEDNTDKGIIYSSQHADGRGWETINCMAYGSRYPISEVLDDESKKYMVVHGRETYQVAVRTIVDLIICACSSLDISHDDIGLVIPHQMNARIMESVIKRLKLPEDKMFKNIEKYGNTSSASIAIALDEAISEGKAKKGDLVMLVAFGGGLTWGLNVIRL